ncbi:MAG TPA: ribbon-helix-helix protein, CopG family [Acidobacteriaceae bacterium]|nr:ribbon-helix-helix protein, CopG family [Acidobacteriaceae bacterium]
MPKQTKPKPIGRPKLPKGSAKAGKVQARLNPEELKRLEAAAKAKDLSVSDFIREAINAAIR